MTEQSALLKDLQAEDFAVYESALYLNGHPTCQKALQYYCEHRAAAMELKESYEKNYGPLSIYGNRDNNCWQWVSTPWPWEKEAN